MSIGDSYAAGYQPTGSGAGATTTNGFAYQLVARAAANGTPVRLVNFGCSGITSTALLTDRGCDPVALGPGAARLSRRVPGRRRGTVPRPEPPARRTRHRHRRRATT